MTEETNSNQTTDLSRQVSSARFSVLLLILLMTLAVVVLAVIANLSFVYRAKETIDAGSAKKFEHMQRLQDEGLASYLQVDGLTESKSFWQKIDRAGIKKVDGESHYNISSLPEFKELEGQSLKNLRESINLNLFSIVETVERYDYVPCCVAEFDDGRIRLQFYFEHWKQRGGIGFNPSHDETFIKDVGCIAYPIGAEIPKY